MYIPKSPPCTQYIWKCNLLYVKWKMQFSNAWQQVLVKWSDTICYLVSYSHLQHDKLHFSRVLRSKGSWHAFIDLHRLYACIPVCRQIVPQVNSSHCASVSRKLQSSQGSQDGVRLGKRDMQPIGILEPLLRFIGCRILLGFSIILSKPFLSSVVYKNWQL